MGKPYKYKSVSTDFAVFLNTFLIISTVIVFAVLVFISYQNVSNEFISNSMSDSGSVCADAINDYLSITQSVEDENQRNSLIGTFLRSNVISDKGAIFIVDAEGHILYSNTHPLLSTDLNTEIPQAIDGVNSSNGKLYQTYTDLTGTLSRIVTADVIADTGLYAVVINELQASSYISEYMNIIFYPVLVSMVAAIALFIGFVGLTIRPLRDISRTMSSVAAGDLTARVDEKYTMIGDRSGMLTLSSDLTEMARNVNSMIESLANHETDSSMFISSVAHDIPTPLTSITGFVTAMLDGTIPPEPYE